MRPGITLSGIVLLLLAVVVPAQAQEARVTGPDELNAAVVERAESKEQQRAKLLELLEREDVRAVGERGGVDVERARSAAMALSDSQLGVVAPLVETITADLAGGQTLVISATTLILILLLVILIIVAT